LNFFRVFPTYCFCRTCVFCRCIVPSMRFRRADKAVSYKLRIRTYLMNRFSGWQSRYVMLRVSCPLHHVYQFICANIRHSCSLRKDFDYEGSCFLGDCPDDGGSKHFRNVAKHLPDYTAEQPRSQQSPSRRRETLNSNRSWLHFEAKIFTDLNSRQKHTETLIQGQILSVQTMLLCVLRVAGANGCQ
jgi:hypothetical protein